MAINSKPTAKARDRDGRSFPRVAIIMAGGLRHRYPIALSGCSLAAAAPGVDSAREATRGRLSRWGRRGASVVPGLALRRPDAMPEQVGPMSAARHSPA